MIVKHSIHACFHRKIQESELSFDTKNLNKLNSLNLAQG